jgi:hypothetical protein
VTPTTGPRAAIACWYLSFILNLLMSCNAGQVPALQSNNSVADTFPSACKRGLAYNAASAADLSALGVAANWYYTWSVQPTPLALAADTTSAKRFVPMLWGRRALADTQAKDVPASAVVLAFNEPNFTAQANLTPAEAAALWPQVEALARDQNRRIVSPAVNYCAGACTVPDPFDWLDQFFAACPNCRVDAIGVHAYVCIPSALQAYLDKFTSRYKRPLWLTEFACLDTAAPSAAQEMTFMQAVLPILEANPAVERYAWFTGRYPDASAVDLFAGPGELTPLGQAYKNLPQNCRP